MYWQPCALIIATIFLVVSAGSAAAGKEGNRCVVDTDKTEVKCEFTDEANPVVASSGEWLCWDGFPPASVKEMKQRWIDSSMIMSDTARAVAWAVATPQEKLAAMGLRPRNATYSLTPGRPITRAFYQCYDKQGVQALMQWMNEAMRQQTGR